MTLWDLRQTIESNVPLWMPFAVLALAIVVATWISWKLERRAKK